MAMLDHVIIRVRVLQGRGLRHVARGTFIRLTLALYALFVITRHIPENDDQC